MVTFGRPTLCCVKCCHSAYERVAWTHLTFGKLLRVRCIVQRISKHWHWWVITFPYTGLTHLPLLNYKQKLDINIGLLIMVSSALLMCQLFVTLKQVTMAWKYAKILHTCTFMPKLHLSHSRFKNVTVSSSFGLCISRYVHLSHFNKTLLTYLLTYLFTYLLTYSH